MKDNKSLLGNFVIFSSLIIGAIYSALFYNQSVVGIGFFYFYLVLLLVLFIGKFIKTGKLHFHKIDLIYVPLLLNSLVPALTQNPTVSFVSICVAIFGAYFINIYNVWDISLRKFGFLNNLILSLFQFVSEFTGLSGLRRALAKPVANNKSNLIGKIVVGFIIALPFSCLFIALFSSSDQIFGKLIENFTNLNWSGDAFNVIALSLIIATISILTLSSYFFHNFDKSNSLIDFKGNFDPTILLTFIAIINVIFLTFIITQFIYLFGNREIVVNLGIVYSDYARKGFSEMIFASFVSVGIISITKMIVSHISKKINTVLNVLLAINALFNIVILYSAFRRLDLYVSGYGLSELRLYIYAIIFFIGLIFIFFVISLIVDIVTTVKGSFIQSNIKHTLLVSCIFFAVVTFGLGVLNPDAMIAKVNVQKETYLQESTERLYQEPIDIDYVINNFSSDAYTSILNQELVKINPEQYCMMTYKWVQENKVRNNLSSLNLYKYFNDSKIYESLKDYLTANKELNKDICNKIYGPTYKTYDYSSYYPDSYNYKTTAVYGEELKYEFPKVQKLSFLNVYDRPSNMKLDGNQLLWTPKTSDINRTHYFSFYGDDYEIVTLEVSVVYPYNIKNISVGPFGTMQVTALEKLVDGDASYPNLAVVNTQPTQLTFEFNKSINLKGFKVSVSGEGKDGSRSYKWAIKNKKGKSILSNYETKTINEFVTIDLSNVCKDNSDCNDDEFELSITRNNGDKVVHIMEVQPILE